MLLDRAIYCWSPLPLLLGDRECAFKHKLSECKDKSKQRESANLAYMHYELCFCVHAPRIVYCFRILRRPTNC